MAYLRYRHKDFESYLFDRLRTSINVVMTLSFLLVEDHTIPEISNFINNHQLTPNMVSDAYAIVDRLETWQYIVRNRDFSKYNSKKDHFQITDKGKELLSLFPAYLITLQELLNNVATILANA